MRNLFLHRRGFCLAVLYVAFIFLLSFIKEGAKPFLLIGTALLLFLFLALKKRKRAAKPLFALFLVLSLSIVPSYVYDLSDARIEASLGETVDLTLTVESVRSLSEESATVNARVTAVGGKRASTRVQATLDTADIQTGDVVTAKGVLEEITSSSTLAKGYRYALSATDAKVTGETTSVRIFGAKTRAQLAAVFTERVGGEEADLLSALLLGERDDLSRGFRVDMSRLGTSHMLALSGLHLSILLLGIERLLRRVGVDKSYRYGTVAVLTVLYLILTGFPSSAMRAGVMLLFVFLSFFLKRDYDVITSLGFSVALICTLEPYAVLDTSLWLSALATFGILLLLARERQSLVETQEPSFLRRLSAYLSSSVKITLAASLATLPLTAYMFGKLPLLLIFANLLFAPLMQFLITGGVLVLLFGWIPIVSKAVAFLARIMLLLASRLSAISGTQISLKEPFVLIVLLILVALLFLYFSFSPKRIFSIRAAACLVLSASLLIGGFYGIRLIRSTSCLSVWYASAEAGKADYFLLKEGRHTTVIDSTTANSAHFREIDGMVFELGECEIDNYVFTAYSEKLDKAVETLVTSYAVHHLYLPTPKTDAESALASSIYQTAEDNFVSVTFYAKGQPLALGDAALTLHFSEFAESYIKRTAFSLSYGEERFTYLSRGMLLPEDISSAKDYISNSDTVFFGSYGTKVDYTLEKPSLLTDAEIYATEAAALPFLHCENAHIASVHSLRWK